MNIQKKKEKRQRQRILNKKLGNYRLIKDPKYKSIIFSKFINRITNHGKKIKINKYFYFSLKKIKREFRYHPLKIINKFIKIISPSFSIKYYNIAGKPFLIPYALDHLANKFKFIFNWLKYSINYQINKNVNQRFTKEIFDILLFKINTNTIQQKINLQQKIKENKQNIHYKWKKY